MREVIAKLKTLLPAAEFIVTGSYVLAEYGLVPKENVADLDIILLKPEPTAVNNLVNLMRDFPARTKPPKGVQDMYIFMEGITKVDVFVTDKFKEPTLLVEGVRYATIPHIISAKKSYGKMKHWLQLRDMARLFFKEEDFQTMLNNSWKTTLNSDY
jgi:hypothetical protein